MQFRIELVRRMLLVGALAGAALASGCAGGPITQTAFQRAASDAASVVSAAAQTLRFVHAGQLTVEYGKAAMVNFGEQLSGVPEELPQMDGAPADAASLAALVEIAAADIAAPCLTPDCDWQSQAARLDEAHAALVEASG